VHLTPVGDVRRGSRWLRILSNFVDILTVGNVDVYTKTLYFVVNKVNMYYQIYYVVLVPKIMQYIWRKKVIMFFSHLTTAASCEWDSGGLYSALQFLYSNVSNVCRSQLPLLHIKQRRRKLLSGCEQARGQCLAPFLKQDKPIRLLLLYSYNASVVIG
jgi:hypothetical protein